MSVEVPAPRHIRLTSHAGGAAAPARAGGGEGGGGGGGTSVRGLPISKPPYGSLTAVDLTKGEILWSVPHGDTHDLWINPRDNRLMILGDDGGAQVTLNRGRTWSSWPRASMYETRPPASMPQRSTRRSRSLGPVLKTASSRWSVRRSWPTTRGS